MASRKTISPLSGLYAGTSGWSYASWKPGFYPAETKAKQFLGYYASRLNTVEVNYTFSKLPAESMVAEWIAATPENFRFSFKAPQRMTHFRRLRDCGEQLRDFLAAIAPVEREGRMGAVLFQLPPNFKRDAGRLRSFLAEPALKGGRGLAVAFEFRHASWFDQDTEGAGTGASEGLAGEVFEALSEANAALCLAESDVLAAPEVHTADFSYYRLRKSEYTQAEMDGLAKRMSARSAKGPVYAYFKHEEAPDGPLRAEAVLREAEAVLRKSERVRSSEGGAA